MTPAEKAGRAQTLSIQIARAHRNGHPELAREEERELRLLLGGAPAPKPGATQSRPKAPEPRERLIAAPAPTLKHVTACYDPGPPALVLGQPSARERVAAAAGMDPALAATFTDRHLTEIAPAFAAMTGRTKTR